ncbi:alpha/beta hydrolase [Nocardioides litoris]|uniref:alpha/beta hydrolase n=1 Tax=Nocardioides litoris TaxID=1926648 RepID=UPI0011238845|nr:alpha/beta hydrolase [Nocardioides litoris]
MPLDPGIAALLELIEAAPYPPMHEGTPETARKAFRAMTVDLVTPETQVPVGSVEELTVADRPARLYKPATDGPVPTLVYLHGGGFVIGDLDTHDQTCRRLCARAEVAVLSVDYRLAPEAPYPAAVDDALAAVAWAADHLAELGGAEVLGVGGDSAGGNLAAVAAQELGDRVAAQVLIYPATHMGGDYPSRTDNGEGYFLDMATMLWFAGHYLGEAADLDDPRHSPLLGSADGVARALVVTAEFDPLRDEGEAYADKLAEAGVAVDRVRYDGLIHGFIDMGPMSPAAAAALDDVADRVGRLLRA